MNEPAKKKVEEIKQKVADAKHMGKPDAPNVKTLYDANGHWVCEIYTVGHKIK